MEKIWNGAEVEKVDWKESRAAMESRTAAVTRVTRETNIALTFAVDGSGKAEVQTGIGFFDHMLNSFARHGFFDLDCKVKGDLYVDCHHTVEDTGIVLGEAVKKALGDKRGIRRYGSFLLPMDEALVLWAIKRVSGVSGAVSCRWMKHWCFAPLICPAGRIWYLTRSLIQSVSGILTRRW